MREGRSQIRKLPGPGDAYGRASAAAVSAIEMNIVAYGGVGAAITGISRKYQLSKAWLRRLWDGHPVAVTLDRYERLIVALDDAAERQRAAADLAQARHGALRSADAARDAHGPAHGGGVAARLPVEPAEVLDQES